MFLLLMFLTTGGSYILVDALAPILLLALALGVVALPVYLGVSWLSWHTPIYKPLIASWEWLSGWHVGQNIAANPPSDPHASMGIIVLGLAAALVGIGIAIGNAVVALTAIIALPAGLLVTIAGGVAAIFTLGRSAELFKLGLGIVTLGIGAAALAGVLMRMIDLVSYIGSTQPAPWGAAAGPIFVGVAVAAIAAIGLSASKS